MLLQVSLELSLKRSKGRGRYSKEQRLISVDVMAAEASPLVVVGGDKRKSWEKEQSSKQTMRSIDHLCLVDELGSDVGRGPTSSIALVPQQGLAPLLPVTCALCESAIDTGLRSRAFVSLRRFWHASRWSV